MTPKKKHQHYVPQFLLRKFSADPNRRRIAIFHLSSGRSIPGASLADQCSRDYFYGVDPQLEDDFMASEGRAATILGDLDVETLRSINFDGLCELREFLHIQSFRTAGAAEITNEFVDTISKAVLKESPDGCPPDLDKARIGHAKPQFRTLYDAATSTPVLLDLAVKFLVRDKPPGFILGDDPVAVCNQWAEHHPKFKTYRGICGRASKGVQLFLPLSPKVCLAVYDPATYSVGSEASQVRAVDAKDVRLLNRLQVISAVDCVYYHPDWSDPIDLAETKPDWAAQQWTPTTFLGPKIKNPDGTLSQILQTRMSDLRIGDVFGFAKTTDTDPYEDYNAPLIPARSRDLVIVLEQYRKFVDEKLKSAVAQKVRAQKAARA